jgi:hypothetical protein
MKIMLRITRRGASLYEGIHEVIDQDSFGSAFAKAWQAIRAGRLERTTSVGELMDISMMRCSTNCWMLKSASRKGEPAGA